MKKNIILWVAASVAVMLALPWLAVAFVKGDTGMAVCLLLFLRSIQHTPWLSEFLREKI